MGTAQVTFAVVLCGGAIGSHVTGSDVNHVTGSDVSHMTGSDVSHVTRSDISHVSCPKVFSAHTKPKVAQFQL
jgi:hypothetical protein